jgi:hypothetical protein
MPAIIKTWNGIMDTDSPNDTMHPDVHKMALNVRFKQNRVENIYGTTLLTNTLPDGVNVTIGGIYDEVKNRIIYFNYNSNNSHGIYIYDIAGNTTTPLLVCGSATDGDILNFSLTQVITSVDIIYNNVTDGNILCYIDSINRPTCLNIGQYLNTPYALTKRSYINLAKAPPTMPPHCTYENDTTTTINNLKNSLFKFYSQYEYDNFLKSTYSAGIITSLPLHPFDQAVDGNGNLNNRISIYIQTGDINVKKLYIWGQQTTDSNTSDYFLIVALDKAALSIPDNSIYRFLFYNDALYPFGNVVDQGQVFDWVPQKANAQALLNGNVLVFGGVTEGYNKVAVNLSYASSTLLAGLPISTYNGLLFFASQNGVDSGGTGNTIILYLTGAGTNDGSGNPTTLANCKTIFVVDCALADGTTKKFSYTNTTDVATTASIFSGLATAATAQGFTIVSTGTNTMTITQTGIVLYYAQVVNALTSSFDNTKDAYYAYPRQAALEYGIQYYDADAKTNGTNPSAIGGITTGINESLSVTPQITITINNRPPNWAYYYAITRTVNLTYNKRVEWVSNQTFKELDLNNNVYYAYVGISNMFEYNVDISAQTPVVHYSFAPGDRIRFIQRYINGNPANPYSSYPDYEIFSTVVNPVYNGVVQQGTFIKIVYPTADITTYFDFGGFNFQNYQILIYSYIKHAIDTTGNVYYEFSRQYAIGKPTTSTRYHIGSDQTQSQNLSQPAIVISTEGDYFFRYRNVPAGNTYFFTTAPFQNGYVYIQVGMTVDNAQTLSNYTIQSATQHQTNSIDPGDYTAANCFFLNTSSGNITIRVRATIPINTTTQTGNGVYIQVVNSDTTFTLIKAVEPVISSTDGTLTLNVDSFVNVQAGGHVHFYVVNTAQAINQNIVPFQIRVDVINNVQIPITEASYSDRYNIVTNNNSRASLYDPNAKQTYYPTMVRWGLDDQINTNINQINKFYPLNFDVISLDGGDIQRFKARDRILRVFQTRKTGQMGIYSKFVQDSGGNQLLTTTNDIITKNNIQYYEGIYGIGTQPTGLISTSNEDYFVDPILGEEVRLAPNGLNSLSALYLGKYYIKSLLLPYQQPFRQDNGAYSKVLGCYDYVEKQFVRILQNGTLNSETINSYAYSFNVQRNGFCSFYSYAPEWAVGTGEAIYTFLNGLLYVHNNATPGNYTNFYGVQYPSSVTLTFNDKEAIKKNYLAVSYQANQILASPTNGDINTEMINPQTGLQQISQLIEQDYEVQENQRYAAFLRDANSMTDAQIALLEGEFLQGKWIEIKFEYQGNNFMYFYVPYLTYAISNRNF